MGAHFKLTPSHRAAIEDQIESLIAMLDGFDGDVDLEDDDPAGTDLDAGEGEGDHGRGLHRLAPRYDLDQSIGPINYAAAERDHHADLLGWVRLSGGGWRKPH